MNRERSEKGAVLVLVAVSLLFLLGLAALVIDLGYLYLTKNQLHVAADGAALAGATQIVSDTDCTSTSPSPTNNYAARTEALTFAGFHNAGSQTGQTAVTLALNTGNDPDGDIVLGNFTDDENLIPPRTDNFLPCPTSDGSSVNAVRVRARRTSEGADGSIISSSNAPVSTFFASALNPALATSNVAAFATAIGGVKGGLPICILPSFTFPASPTTTVSLTLNPATTDTVSWTTFFENGAPYINSYIANPPSIPCVGLGTPPIKLQGGTVSSAINNLQVKFNASKQSESHTGVNPGGSEWCITLPICTEGSGNTGTITDSSSFCITAVELTGQGTCPTGPPGQGCINGHFPSAGSGSAGPRCSGLVE